MDQPEVKEPIKRQASFELNADQVAAVKKIIKSTNELNGRTRFQMSAVVHLLGIDKSNELLTRTLAAHEQITAIATEANPTRSTGEMFLYLAETLHNVAFPKFGEPFLKVQKVVAPPPPAKDNFVLNWENRKLLVDAAIKNLGITTGAKVTLTGRPTGVAQRADSVVIALQQGVKQLGLPKGVPMANIVTNYIVYMGKKQWAKCASVLDDPNDALIIEGTQVYDAEYQAIAILATNVVLRSVKFNKPVESEAAT